jgi:hypothetical protein
LKNHQTIVRQIARKAPAKSANQLNNRIVAQIVILGTIGHSPQDVLSMLAFDATYSDVEIAAVTNYVTSRIAGEESKITEKDVADLQKQTSR